MTWFQRVKPNLETRDYAGACLRFTQTVFDAPVQHRSAWHAWLKEPKRHFNRNFPQNVSVILWFEHYGRYNDGRGQYGPNPNDPYWGNWGHVITRVPGRGYLSSPAFTKYVNGRAVPSQQWFSTIEAVERTFGATYVGWSEGINGLLVVEKAAITEEDPMPVTNTQERRGTQKIGKQWTTLRVHEKGYFSLMEGATTGRRVRAVINLAVSRGDIDVRAVRVVTSSDGSKVASTHTLPFKTLKPGYGDYVFGLDLPKGSTQRIRLQARRRGLLGQVDNVQALVDYWEI